MATQKHTRARVAQSRKQAGRAPATPEAVQRGVLDLVAQASRLTDEGESIEGGPQSRVVCQVHAELQRQAAALAAPLTGQRAAAFQDQLFDAVAQAQGAAALNARTPLGAGAKQAAALLDEAASLMDRPADFWPTEPEPVASLTGVATPEDVRRIVALVVGRAAAIIDPGGKTPADMPARIVARAHFALLDVDGWTSEPMDESTARYVLDTVHDAIALCQGGARLAADAELSAAALLAAQVLDEVPAVMNQPAGFWPPAAAPRLEFAALVPTPALARDPLQGYSPAQARALFEAIAGKAGELRQFLTAITGQVWEVDRGLANSIDVARSLAELIGILADRPAGEEIYGNVEAWAIGQGFRELQGAAA